MKYFILSIAIFMGGMLPFDTAAQKKDNAEIASMISAYMSDARGPYRDIRWFCKDGTTVSPQERCQGELGVQRARYKQEVINLAKSNHVFLGQILSTTTNEDFWDASNHQSRLKQYQLEQFLKAADNGWVNQKAQYYRGAFQAEDESAWGVEFYKWVLSDANRSKDHFFLIRQSAKDIPHNADDNTTLKVRALSKEIADEYSGFMNLRVKIHGQPEQSDIQKVKDFRKTNTSKLSASTDKKMTQLIAEMERMYLPVDVNQFKPFLKSLPVDGPAAKSLGAFIENYSSASSSQQRCKEIAQTAFDLRIELTNGTRSKARLAILDASNRLELLLQREASEWKPSKLDELLAKVKTLAHASTGFGYLEVWEWEQLEAAMQAPSTGSMELVELNYFVEAAKRSVEWGAGMIRANYGDAISLFAGFEPLATGFVDEKVRASILLELGSSVSQLGDFYTAKAGFSNQVMRIPNQSSMRGLNPGYAMGELVVTDQSPDQLTVDPQKIYVFERPPADLKPVAGIATVSEGNLVSHVQLLARNLGIPNAVLSSQNLKDLKAFNGKTVFYAVSFKGTVILKLASDMTEEERQLFSKKSRDETKIRVPLESMQLNDPKVLNLRDVDAKFSGKICGPKAANLGQLKQIYPEQVVEGLVIPFSIFKQHVDQTMPGQNTSYWTFLKATFEQAEKKRGQGLSDMEVETYVLGRLATLREAIKTMPLLPEFKVQLEKGFVGAFGKKIGEVPVFLRSDTNMEDLKDFTGAGLNLTLFNVRDANKIWQGIRDVWASPYTERSYSWRQKYLLDPENIYPSILVIPSVDADYSGVMITKGVSSGNETDVTVAFNRGVGGAVEGQASETWLIRGSKFLLVSPAREAEYMTLPTAGGTVKKHTSFEKRLLDENRLKLLQEMAASMKKTLPEYAVHGPYDVELGFKDDKIWLFQVRPFVENKRANGSGYLQSITPVIKSNVSVPVNTAL